jgi:hypothetical protein
VVTEPGEISRWFSDAAEIELRPGGEGTLMWDQRATNERACVRATDEHGKGWDIHLGSLCDHVSRQPSAR